MTLRPVEALQLLAGIAICELIGGIGALVTLPSIPIWYAGIAKPSFTPPAGVFGPVWTILFALMGAALFLVWRRRREGSVSVPLTLFGVQLALNLLWSILFFGFHLLFFAVLEIILLWVAIFWTIAAFRKVDAAAAYLLLPYLLWVSFAAILTFTVWRLN